MFVSPVSLLEISIKYALNKLSLTDITPEGLWPKAVETGIVLLPFSAEDALGLHRLDVIHKDPFDRMIVWLSIRHGMTLVSRDRRMKAYEKYGLNLIW